MICQTIGSFMSSPRPCSTRVMLARILELISSTCLIFVSSCCLCRSITFGAWDHTNFQSVSLLKTLFPPLSAQCQSHNHKMPITQCQSHNANQSGDAATPGSINTSSKEHSRWKPRPILMNTWPVSGTFPLQKTSAPTSTRLLNSFVPFWESHAEKCQVGGSCRIDHCMHGAPLCKCTYFPCGAPLSALQDS